MKEADKIKFNLMRFVESHSYDVIIPNYFVHGYEMDLFRLGRNGFITEYEIKISRSDFFADFKKRLRYDNRPGHAKHERMVNGNCKANKFYYVTPTGLIEEKEVPEYAGLICYNNGSLAIVKNAPFLHKEKSLPDGILPKLAARCNNLNMKMRNQVYHTKELEKRVALLKGIIKQHDPKNIQLF